MAGAEDPSRGGQHDHPHDRIAGRRPEGFGKRAHHRPREDVCTIGIVERQPGDRPFDDADDEFVGNGALLWRTISLPRRGLLGKNLRGEASRF
jgi:hypothetical protein